MSTFPSLVMSVVLFAGAATVFADPPSTSPKSRTFNFTYAATVQGLPPNEPARIWLPMPSSDEDQQVQLLQQNLAADSQSGRETMNGNHILYFQTNARPDGSIPLSVTYRITRYEISEDTQSSSDVPDRYLHSDRLVPIDGKPMSLIKDKTLPSDQIALAHTLYDVVDDHMQYRKDKPGWGRGDAVWACDSGFGNCTDFHSLFISLARSEHVPAKFEIGFAIPEKIGAGSVTGYHCWAKFLPQGHGWVPVDIAQANQIPERRDYFFGHLTENRVAFSTGRDLVLVPPQAGPPLNFFIYPYVEIKGTPVPQQQIHMSCTYTDAPTTQPAQGQS